jgi:hypothetical protein
MITTQQTVPAARSNTLQPTQNRSSCKGSTMLSVTVAAVSPHPAQLRHYTLSSTAPLREHSTVTSLHTIHYRPAQTVQHSYVTTHYPLDRNSDMEGQILPYTLAL